MLATLKMQVKYQAYVARIDAYRKFFLFRTNTDISIDKVVTSCYTSSNLLLHLAWRQYYDGAVAE